MVLSEKQRKRASHRFWVASVDLVDESPGLVVRLWAGRHGKGTSVQSFCIGDEGGRRGMGEKRPQVSVV